MRLLRTKVPRLQFLCLKEQNGNIQKGRKSRWKVSMQERHEEIELPVCLYDVRLLHVLPYYIPMEMQSISDRCLAFIWGSGLE